jgi:hypothetical protein
MAKQRLHRRDLNKQRLTTRDMRSDLEMTSKDLGDETSDERANVRAGDDATLTSSATCKA